MLRSLKGEIKYITKNYLNIYSTTKIEDTEELGRHKQDQSPI